jgi:hypothetical protein
LRLVEFLVCLWVSGFFSVGGKALG